jgi:fatty acid-binding protein DegV
MGDYILSCCSTADLTEEHFRARNIHYICFHYTLDGVEYPDDLGRSMPFDVFYDRIAKGSTASTSQVGVGEYEAYFEPFLQEGLDIVHATLSSGISGTYTSACAAAAGMVNAF